MAAGRSTRPDRRFLFIALAFYGSGLEAGLWCLALLAGGLVVGAIMHKLNSADDLQGAEA